MPIINEVAIIRPAWTGVDAFKTPDTPTNVHPDDVSRRAFGWEPIPPATVAGERVTVDISDLW